MKKITKAQWDALGDIEKAKYEVSADNADEYILTEEPAPAPTPEPKNELPDTPPKGETEEDRQKRIDDEIKKGVDRELRARKKREEEARATKAGEFEKLYNELKPIADQNEAKVESLTKTVEALIKGRKGQLNDKYKGLDPEYDDLAKELKWLENAANQQAQDEGKPPAFGNPANPAPQNKMSEEDVMKRTRDAMAVGAPRRM